MDINFNSNNVNLNARNPVGMSVSAQPSEEENLFEFNKVEVAPMQPEKASGESKGIVRKVGNFFKKLFNPGPPPFNRGGEYGPWEK